jgi:hypothetical protein
VSKFRIVIFSSASPTSLDHFLRRLERDLPEVEVAGVLYEARPSKLSRAKRISRALRILGEITFPIAPFDTLESIGLKADLLAIDLLIDVLRNERLGGTMEVPQCGPSMVYKGFQPHQVFAIERQIQARRLAFKPAYSRPIRKLLLRTLIYPAAFLRNLKRGRAPLGWTVPGIEP